MRGERREHGERPQPPVERPAPIERSQQGEERHGAREREEAVHAPVDAVEERDPAGREQDRCDQRDPATGQAREEARHGGDACDREHHRYEAYRRERGGAERDEVDEQEVERGAAALLQDDVQHLVEGLRAHEQRQRLVFVRWPGMEPGEQECRHGGRRSADAQPEPPPRHRLLHGFENTRVPDSGTWQGRVPEPAEARASIATHEPSEPCRPTSTAALTATPSSSSSG